MKMKHYIGRLLARVAAIFLITLSTVAAADKVVVIPLDSGNCDCDAISTVTSANQVWMDRNLGALRVATGSTDYHAYGYLFQWGRLADGHEIRSSTTETLSSDDVPGHGDFIITSLPPYDWRVSKKDTLWQGESGINNPCPNGFRLPTEAEWETEWVSWGSYDSAGAFASPLKLVVAGSRNHSNGGIDSGGFGGYYWSSTINGSDARSLRFINIGVRISDDYRARGRSVRCIKD